MLLVLADVLAQVFSSQNKATVDKNDSNADSNAKTCFEDKVCFSDFFSDFLS